MGKSIFTINEYARHLGVDPDSSKWFIDALVYMGGAKKMYKAKQTEVDRYEVYGLHTMEKKTFKFHDPFGFYERKAEPLHLEWRKGAQIT